MKFKIKYESNNPPDSTGLTARLCERIESITPNPPPSLGRVWNTAAKMIGLADRGSARQSRFAKIPRRSRDEGRHPGKQSKGPLIPVDGHN